MKISLIAAVAENRIIGFGLDIPWQAKGEQLLFKAITFNQWLLVGRKTFDSMGKLPNRKYAVISRTVTRTNEPDVLYFASTEEALENLENHTNHVIVSGGGEIYKAMLPLAETVHLSLIHKALKGDVYFPELPSSFDKVFEQSFSSNIDYTYQIWQSREEL